MQQPANTPKRDFNASDAISTPFCGQGTRTFAPYLPIRERVLIVLQAGGWWTKFDIRDALEMAGGRVDTDTVAAKVRDLRKAKYGGHNIPHRPVRGKAYCEYQLIDGGPNDGSHTE